MLIFKDRHTIDKLKKENYDFVLVDLPQAMLLPYKLSLPFGIIGLDAPHFIRKIPYMPRYKMIKVGVSFPNEAWLICLILLKNPNIHMKYQRQRSQYDKCKDRV